MQNIQSALASFIVGFIFAVGLALSGMTQPEKVLSFLDIFGKWDPSLAFVMIGAIGVHFFTFHFIKKAKAPLTPKNWHVPTKKEITPALVLGSTLLGAGWGLVGFCPGPALASFSQFNPDILIFLGAMISGMILFRWVDTKFKINR